MGVSAVDLIARLGSLGSDSGCNTARCHSPTQPNHSEKPGPDDDLLQVAALDQGIYTFGIGTTNTASDSDAPLVISSAFFVIRLLLAAAVLYGSSNRSRECDILAMLRSHCIHTFRAIAPGFSISDQLVSAIEAREQVVLEMQRRL